MRPSPSTSTTNHKAQSPDLFVMQSTRKRAAAEMLEGPEPQKVKLVRRPKISGPAPPKHSETPQAARGPPLNRAEPPKKSRPNFSKPDAEFVTILAGPKEEKFRTHRHVITHDSSWFRDHFNRQHIDEGESKILILKDVEPEVFGLYNNWVYSQSIEHAPNPVTGEVKQPELMELAKLWTWAGFWGVPELQNQAVKMLAKLFLKGTTDIGKEGDLWKFLRHAYDGAPGKTPLKLLAVEKLTRIAPSLIPLRAWVGDFPDGLMVDFTEALMKQVGRLSMGTKPRTLQFETLYVKEND